MASEPAGRRALAVLDKLLAERPHKAGHEFSEASRCLAAYRDELIASVRGGAGASERERLAGVNAVLSVVIGGHFPLGDIPWEHIEKARGRLAAVLRND